MLTMIPMKACRRGARTAYDGTTPKPVKVEIGVEIGTIINVEASYKDNTINEQDLQAKVQEKVEDIFDIDGRDKVLNGICIYSIQ